eukprot:8431891-Pyramimonas_sp.AAC.1
MKPVSHIILFFLRRGQKAEMDGLTDQMHRWLDSSRAGGRAPTRADVNEAHRVRRGAHGREKFGRGPDC